MEKRNLSPMEMLNIATQHAYCADYILEQTNQGMLQNGQEIEALIPITSLMYLAFRLTFKAYYTHESGPIKEYKNLTELVELNAHLGISSHDVILLKTLARQQVFNKGQAYDLWEDSQQLHVFCEKIVDLYERIQSIMPIELRQDYQ